VGIDLLHKVCNQIFTAVPLTENQKTASMHERRVVPINNPDFKYLRFQAIGNMEVDGLNGNHDGFPYEYFEDERAGYGYQSFRNKSAHLEHNSSKGIVGAIGDLPDAYLNRFIYPQEIVSSLIKSASVPHWADFLGKDKYSYRDKILNYPKQKDGSIEVLMRIDVGLLKESSKIKLLPEVKAGLERIARAIETGQKIACSMGTNVQYSSCTACGNSARFASDYCNHLKHRKGAISIVTANEIRDMLDREQLRAEWLKHLLTNKNDVREVIAGISNRGMAIRNGEMNHELSFFELSVVAIPAYAKGIMLQKVARQQSESRHDYIKRIASEFGQDSILDIYEYLQEEGLISSQCRVN
jgi:hypothetical protein